MAYAAIEPFGEYREELRHGQKMAQYANYHRGEKREPYQPKQFMNFIDPPEPVKEKKMTVAELEAYADRVFG